MSNDNFILIDQQQKKKKHNNNTELIFKSIDLHDQLNMYQDFLHLKNKENVLDDEFHDKTPLDLIELNHISY